MALEQCRRAACIIELVQQRRKCILGEFAALLDIRRFVGCILRRDSLADMEVTNFFRQTAFGGRDLEQEQSLKGQLAIPCKVFAWVPGKKAPHKISCLSSLFAKKYTFFQGAGYKTYVSYFGVS